MSLLFSNPLTSLSFHPSSSSSLSPLYSSSTLSVFKQLVKPIDLHAKLINGNELRSSVVWRKRGSSVVRGLEDADGAPTGGEDKSLGVEKLPLESKMQEREEQKLRMKMAKKIRLRRKRLVRKRRLRKKGRWPPSKMKKLKNV